MTTAPTAPCDRTLPTPPRVAPVAYWGELERLLNWLHVLFGPPAQVAFLLVVRLTYHQQLASWLRCAEAMVRRLLVIEAAAYAKPNVRPLLHPSRKRERKKRVHLPEEPQNWRVRFRVLDAPRRPRVRPVRYGPPKPYKRVSREDRWSYENFKPVQLRSIWPLAERYEALLRVVRNPAPYAQRLSRRLHARPYRIFEALEAPPEAVNRIDGFEDAFVTAVTAWAPPRRRSG